jgi:hypothetical protein
MSYARFGWDESDVYVFLATEGHLECCACDLSSVGAGFAWFGSTAELVEHLRYHEQQGHVVPDETFAQLATDADANDEWIRAKARGDDDADSILAAHYERRQRDLRRWADEMEAQ